MYESKIDGDVVVVGDVHGDYEQTKQLLGHLAVDKIIDDRWVVFLGDYVDCGPDTAKTIQLLLSFKKYHQNTTFLCGNHDLNLAKALGLVPCSSNDQAFYWNRIHQRNGATLRSYGAKDGVELFKYMPDTHKEFLANLPWLVEHPDYLFVHAGFDPFEPLQPQIEQLNARDTNIHKPKWLYRNDLAFQSHAHQTEKWVISGHMHVQSPGAIDNKILIDTAAGYGGPLTALILPEVKIIQTEIPKPKINLSELAHA